MTLMHNNWREVWCRFSVSSVNSLNRNLIANRKQLIDFLFNLIAIYRTHLNYNRVLTVLISLSIGSQPPPTRVDSPRVQTLEGPDSYVNNIFIIALNDFWERFKSVFIFIIFIIKKYYNIFLSVIDGWLFAPYLAFTPTLYCARLGLSGFLCK